MDFFKKKILRVLAVMSCVSGALALAARLDPLPQGLRADYFPNADWTPPASRTTLVGRPSTDTIADDWDGAPPQRFSVTWTGAVLATRSGTYTFATESDDGSAVYVDQQLVVDNLGHHERRRATGSIHLVRGAHTLAIRYFQDGGGYSFDFLWARDGSTLAPVPAWALWPRRVASLPEMAASELLSLAIAPSEWLWVALLVAAAVAAAWPLMRWSRTYLEQRGLWSALRWILLGSLALNLVGLWWGLPDRWVPIELHPEYVFGGLSEHFSRGWFDAYPPFHFYVLTAAMSPLLLLQALGRFSPHTVTGYATLLVTFRLVSIATAAGTVVAICLCGLESFGRRAGLFAAAIVALTTPFIYYSKTANVDGPYLFWFAVSLVFYLRIFDGGSLADYVMFGVSATLAVCTKDQAYALYLFAPPAIVFRLWQAGRRTGVAHPLVRALVDKRLVAAAAAAAALFAACHNLLFNFSGFMSHVRFITGPGSEAYRVFEPTSTGRWRLLELTMRLVELSMGWPLLLFCLAGLVVAGAASRMRPLVVWLALPVLSYYLGFIDVVLYNYDRFVLPICYVLALFGGLAFDRFLTAAAIPRWRAVTVGAAFAYTLLYAGTVDALMVADSRYAVERWMHENIGRDDLVGVSGLHEYLPRLEDFKAVDIRNVEDLLDGRPRFFVLNADYAHAVPHDTEWGQLIAGLQSGALGYRRVLRYRRRSPWPWLPGAHDDLVGARDESVVFSTLRGINPTIEIYERGSSRGRPDKP